MGDVTRQLCFDTQRLPLAVWGAPSVCGQPNFWARRCDCTQCASRATRRSQKQFSGRVALAAHVRFRITVVIQLSPARSRY
eukprot:1933985-Pyramimonas_sp.AAC.1